MWWNLFLLVASYVISYAMRPKPVVPKPTAFEDIQFPQFEEGAPQEVCFGDTWTSSWMVLGVGNYRTTPIVKKSGKKSGSSESTWAAPS